MRGLDERECHCRSSSGPSCNCILTLGYVNYVALRQKYLRLDGGRHCVFCCGESFDVGESIVHAADTNLI